MKHPMKVNNQPKSAFSSTPSRIVKMSESASAVSKPARTAIRKPRAKKKPTRLPTPYSYCVHKGCKKKFLNIGTLKNHITREHWDEEQAKIADAQKVREERRLAAIEDRSTRAANAAELARAGLEQFYDNINPEFETPRESAQQDTTSPEPKEETFHWKTSRAIDIEDIQSDEDEEMTDYPGTLPHIATRLQLYTNYLSETDSDGDSEQRRSCADGRDTERSGLSDKFARVEEDSEDGCQAEKNDDSAEEGKNFEFYVTERKENHATGNLEHGVVPEEMLLFDITGKNKAKGPFSPFRTPFEFKQARWLIRHSAKGLMVTEGYNGGLFAERRGESCCTKCGHSEILEVNITSSNNISVLTQA